MLRRDLKDGAPRGFFCHVPVSYHRGHTIARSRERTEWAKALRLPRTTAAGRHPETRDQRAHHHESSWHRMFSGFLIGQYLLTTSTYITGVCSVAALHTLDGNNPLQFSGTWYCIAQMCVPSQESGRRGDRTPCA